MKISLKKRQSNNTEWKILIMKEKYRRMKNKRNKKVKEFRRVKSKEHVTMKNKQEWGIRRYEGNVKEKWGIKRKIKSRGIDNYFKMTE